MGNTTGTMRQGQEKHGPRKSRHLGLWRQEEKTRGRKTI
jgi:hypothetical protein